jgi:uncharacterized protein with FMN-binding domain
VSKRKRFILIILLGSLVFIILSGIFLRNMIEKTEQEMSHLSQLTIVDVNLSEIEDGEYYGEYEVFPIKVRLVVTIKNHSILDISVLEHRTGQGQQASDMLSRILAAQSLKVDVVTQATYSSIIMQKAVERALLSANE